MLLHFLTLSLLFSFLHVCSASDSNKSCVADVVKDSQIDLNSVCDDCDEEGSVCIDLGFNGFRGVVDTDKYLSDYFAFIKHMMHAKIGNNLFKNFEHTLHHPDSSVKQSAPVGVVSLMDGTDRHYHVYLPNWTNHWEVYTDYSMTNIENIRRSNTHPELLTKMIYIPPLMYSCKFNPTMSADRTIGVLTTFIHPGVERRKKLVRVLTDRNIDTTNINDAYSWDDQLALYQKTRILLNMRQFDHRHTFEELRVLPALLNGVVVISEDVPLQDVIPYREYILFAKLEDLPQLVADTIANYEEVRERIFGRTSKLPGVIREMKQKLLADIDLFAAQKKLKEKKRQK